MNYVALMVMIQPSKYKSLGSIRYRTFMIDLLQFYI